MPMKIRKKLKLGVSFVFGVMLILSWLVIEKIGDFQREQLLNTRFEQLVSLREALTSHIKDYQKSTTLSVETIAHSQTAQQAIVDLSSTYKKISKNNDTLNNKKELLQFYEEKYVSQINTEIPNTKKLKDTNYYLPQSQQGLLIQHQYILGKDVITQEEYFSAHQKYHSYLSSLLNLHGFYDLFLIDTQGNIVYSATKEVDVGTNLLTGAYKETGLANVFRDSHQSNQIAFAAYEPYEPSLNIPSSFLAISLKKDGKNIGSIAIQLPIEPINNIMTFNGMIVDSGLGDTGEAYIVGSDFTMRNDSRFVKNIENPLVQKTGTTIGIQTVKTEAIKKARQGKKGYGLVDDYRDQSVLSAYAPIEIFGESSVLVAEIDYKTVVNKIDSAINDLMLKIIIGVLVLWAAILTFFNQLLLNPLKNINIQLEQELLEQEHQVIVSRSLLNEYKKAVDASAIVSKTDEKGNIIYTNDAFCEATGYSRNEVLGKNHRIIKNPKTSPEVHEELWKTISNKKIWKGIICNSTKEGKEYYLSSTIVPILTIYNDIYEYISIGTDVTELYIRQEEIRLHTIDSLTNLPNRQKFIQETAERKKPRLAIIDINHFSEVNDFYGYDIGDQLIVEISKILLENANKDIVSVFRLAGDEFGLLGTDNCSSKDFEKECITMTKLLDNENFIIEENELNVSVSMGVSEETDNVYVHAGMALRAAKENQKKYLFYNSNVDIQKRTAENLFWTKAIRQAIENDRIELFVQPIVNRVTRSIDKYECLMRLIDEDNKEISPFFFINIAKHARLYPKLSEIIIKKSFEYFSDKTEIFSINLTIIDILNEDTIDLIKSLTQDRTVAERVVLEIVESEGIDNFAEVSEFIQEMKSIGCKIAIDDFGTGYSNFEYLMKLDPDYIKIDGSIIKDIVHDKGAYAITKLIHDFSKSIGTKTIAEFVCNQEITRLLDDIGVDYLQGYYHGKPYSTKN